MKTISRFALVLLLITTIIGCKNTTTPEADAETAEDVSAQMITETPKPTATKAGFGSLSFKMDGTLMEATVPGAIAIYIPSTKEVDIRGNTLKGLFSILMDNVEGTGTYTIKGNSKSGAGLVNMNTQKLYEVKKSGTPFTVTIDAVEDIASSANPDAKSIRGTFEGTIMDEAGNTITITEGKFSGQ